jgi:hypothetical protein
MKLQVGHYYKSREGRIVFIKMKDPEPTAWPFLGSDEEWYAGDGHWSPSANDANRRDLVEDLTPTPGTAPTSGLSYTVTQTAGVFIYEDGAYIAQTQTPEQAQALIKRLSSV